MRYIILTLLFAATCTSSLDAQMRTLNKDLPCVNKKFQVYGHFFLDTLGIANYTPDNLRAELASVNEAFAPICISFELCGVDTITNYEFDSLSTTKEEGEIQTLFHVKNRINFYIISQIYKGTVPVCGFAALGGVATQTNGFVFMSGGCATHELGHLFGLPHTFEGGDELVDGSNCETAGDGFCDTPADPYYDDPDIVWQKDCEFIWEGKDANGDYYSPAVGNIMSYFSCSCGFSREQYLKMASTYLNSNPKTW